MKREEAIEMLKSKLDGKTDTSYEWVEAVGMAIKALEDEGSNAVEMLFPKDWRDFLDYYCFKDTEEIYTNGSYLVQKLRAEQALEHYADGLLDRVLEIIDAQVCCGRLSANDFRTAVLALKGGEQE